MRAWCWRHSLSIALGVCWLVTNALFFMCEPGHWYDFWNGVASCFGGGLVMVLLGRAFWEEGSDPTKPPDDCE